MFNIYLINIPEREIVENKGEATLKVIISWSQLSRINGRFRFKQDKNKFILILL